MRREFEVVEIPEGCCGMGDILIAMRDGFGRDDLIYVLPQKAERFAPMFQGMFPVLVRHQDGLTMSSNSMPPFSLTRAEIEVAKSIFSGPKHIGMTINCALHWAQVRQCHPQLWEDFAERLTKDGWHVFQFGWSPNFSPLKHATHVMDLPVRQLAAAYHAIGRYAGIDTGDMHLALSVGCIADVAVPPDCPDYQHAFWHYRSTSVRYHAFEAINTTMYDSVTSR